MKNIRHPSNNISVVQPEGWDKRHPNLKLPPLSATGGTADGAKFFITWWEPTPDELSVLLRGGKIQLACIGGMPPVKIEVVEEVGASPVVVAH